MPAFDLDVDGVSRPIYSVLNLFDARNGFECNAKDNGHAIGNSSLKPARVVGRGLTRANKSVILRGACRFSPVKTRAKFNPFRRIDAQHGIAQSRG